MIALIDTDGTRLVVWGLGDTEGAALADAEQWDYMTDTGPTGLRGEWQRYAEVSDEQAAAIEAGAVDWEGVSYYIDGRPPGEPGALTPASLIDRLTDHGSKMKKESLRIEFSTAETLPDERAAVRAKLFVNDRPRYQVVRSGDTTGEAQSRAFWAALHAMGYNYAPGAGLVRLTNRGTARLGVLVRVEEIQ